MTKTYKEYEDAPSGYVYFYNYKEPLMEFTGGTGFMGALIHDEKTDQIQCHFCGGWFDTLQHHLKREHNMSTGEYKDKVGLNKTTALISERFRSLLIKKGLERRIKNLRPNKYHTKENRLKIAATLRENRAEKQNQNNTCPEQLLERLTTIYNKLGRTPRFHSGRTTKSGTYIPTEVSFEDALIRVYGSVKKACEMAGIPYRIPGQTVRSVNAKNINKEKVFAFIREFVAEHKRVPASKEIPSNLRSAISRHKLDKKALFRDALAHDGVFKKVDFVVRYDKETLIDFLKIFEKTNGRYPSYSDCKRGLLPNLGRYTYNFGSWKKALKIAFPDYIHPSKNKHATT